jgi:glycosyltransferase involved in cell wall biosynthesis
MNELNSNILLIDNQGLSHYTCYFAKGLAKHRQITLLGFSKEDFYETEASNEINIQFHYLSKLFFMNKSMWNKLIQKPIQIFKYLFKPIVFGNYSIVHIQGHLPLFFLYVPILKIRKRKIFWTMHDIHLRPSSKGLRGKLETSYVKIITQPQFLLSSSNKIFVHGKNLKNGIILKGIASDKITIIPHFDYKYLKKYNTNNDKFKNKNQYILFFGNIKPYKGLDVLINALKIVEKSVGKEKLNVLVAGKGSIENYEYLLDKNNLQYIHILNENIPTNEIPNLFLNSKMVVLPYIDASQSGIIPLAYTFAKSVIVSNVGSLAEYVEHGKTGYVFNKGDTEELAKYIIEYIQNDDLSNAMGNNAYNKLLSEMSLEFVCNIVNKTYNEFF